jgi:hypothetical protein
MSAPQVSKFQNAARVKLGVDFTKYLLIWYFDLVAKDIYEKPGLKFFVVLLG